MTSQQQDSMRFAAALSETTNWKQAVDQVCTAALKELGGVPDLAVLFASGQDPADCDAIAAAVCQQLGSDRLVGCTAESVVGVGREVEQQPALSLWLAKLPGVDLLPMHLTYQRAPDGGGFIGWADELIDGWPKNASLLVMGDPYTFPTDVLLQQINDEQPGALMIGGMASSGSAPGENRLFLGSGTVDEGAVVVMVSGAVRIREVVSQGCRPIGTPFVITRAERNVIQQLGGEPPVVRANEVFATLPTRDREMVRHGLHVGRVVSEYQDHFEQGDFLVRNVINVDTETGAIAIGDYVRSGQTVQFHVRDADTADAELRQLLSSVDDIEKARAGGALLFTCNGRGTRLFREPHHDATAIQQSLGNIPLAGFFAAGEIGPVSGKNYMHGFTASIAIFEHVE